MMSATDFKRVTSRSNSPWVGFQMQRLQCSKKPGAELFKGRWFGSSDFKHVTFKVALLMHQTSKNTAKQWPTLAGHCAIAIVK
jgi:hypothetical protein